MRRVALVIAFFVGTGSAIYRAAPHPRRPSFSVVVATHDLPLGTRIGAEDVAVLHVPRQMVPADGTFQVAEDLIGRTTNERVLTNEMIRAERLARTDAGVGLAAVITPGMRAMSIRVAPFGDDLAPDNVVDLLATDGNRARTVVTQLRVLAVAEDRKAVTLDVTLDEAEAIASALSRGTLFVATRSELDIVRSDGGTGCQAGLGPLYVAPPPRQGVRTRPIWPGSSSRPR